jgi:hypothetical protein
MDDALQHPMPLIITASTCLCTDFAKVIVITITNTAMVVDI